MHNNLFFDRRVGAYRATVRADRTHCPIWYPMCTKSCSMEECLQTYRRSGTAISDGKDPTKWETPLVRDEFVRELPNATEQVYVQVTVPFYNAYLGLIAVFDANTSSQSIHCQLAVSSDAKHWRVVDGGRQDFIPLSRSTIPGRSSDCAKYAAGDRTPHKICTGKRKELADGTLPGCKEACLADGACRAMQWQGEAKHNYSAASLGKCFSYDDCRFMETYANSDFCVEVEEKAFDSNICFPSAYPLQNDSAVHLYYMGGDGTHYGTRNSSLGLALLRPDGFVAVQGVGSLAAFDTPQITVSGPELIITADMDQGGAIQVTSKSVQCAPLVGTNVTDKALTCDWSALVGTNVSLHFEMSNGARLYTFGWRGRLYLV